MSRSKSVMPRARRQSAAGKSGRQLAAVQEKPLKQPGQKQPGIPVADGDDWDEEAEWGDTMPPGNDSGKARQRIELLREERQLQQALLDTFDC